MKYFSIEELVPPRIYEECGESAIELFDWKALEILDWLRENLGGCIVNNWNTKGQFSQSGLRTWEFFVNEYGCTEEVAKKRFDKSGSQHKSGKAFDCKFIKHDAEYVRNWIKDNWKNSGIDCPITIEEDVNWVHFDVRRQPENKVYTFKP